MLARQLVDAPFERLAETEIVAVQRQDTAPLDHLEQPIGERDLDFRHLAGAGLPHDPPFVDEAEPRSEEHTSELQSLMRTSYAVCCLSKTTTKHDTMTQNNS